MTGDRRISERIAVATDNTLSTPTSLRKRAAVFARTTGIASASTSMHVGTKSRTRRDTSRSSDPAAPRGRDVANFPTE